jgi:hypothetical protein
MKPRRSSSSRWLLRSLLLTLSVACSSATTGKIDLLPGALDAGGGIPEPNAGASGASQAGSLGLGGGGAGGGAGSAAAGSAGAAGGAVCATNAQCTGPAAHCASGACVECTTDNDCPDGLKHCQGTKCVACLGDPDCGGGVCQTGICGDECADVSECHGKVPTCTALGLCGECSSDADCTDGSRMRCATASGVCVACLSRADCTSLEQPACRLDGQCVQCAHDADCPSGSCDTSQGQCQ